MSDVSSGKNNEPGKETPPSTSLERAEQGPHTGTNGTTSRLQPGGVIPGGGPAGAGVDDMGKSKKNS